MHTTRFGLGPILVGASAAVGVATILLLIGGAVTVTVAQQGAYEEASILRGAAVWCAIALSLSAYVGGRTGAVSARAVISRHGALVGFLVWAVLDTLLVAIALACVNGANLAAGVRSIADLAPCVPYLWGAAATLIVMLIAAAVGGLHGARSVTPEAYEDLFFEESRSSA